MDKHLSRVMVGLKQLPIRTLLATFWRDPKRRYGLSAAVLAAYLLLARSLRFRRLKRLQRVYGKYTTREEMATMTDHDAWEIQKTMLVMEFPSASLKALQFALFRTYGIPTISGLLLRTSQFSNPATSFKRYADTGALIGQFMAFDPTSERTQTAIARTKFLHTGYRASGKILESDMLYTLSLFALEPIRFIAMFEWRELSELEQCAIGTYWKSLGDALEISFDVLPSGPHAFRDGLHFLEELRAWSLQYERDYMKPTPQNKEVAEKTMDVLLYAVPKVLRPIGVNFASCVMDDRLREAMMYAPPPAIYKAIFSSLVGLRRFYLRHLALPRANFQRIDIFTDKPNEYGRYYVNLYEAIPYYVKPTLWNRWGPGAWVSWAMGMPLPGDEDDKYYPRGFDLEDLGPKYFEGKGRKSVAEIREQLKKERRGQSPFAPEMAKNMKGREEEKDLDAWLLGSGIASLTAAVHLIQEAHVPPSRIHILENLSVAGGTTASYGNATQGYDFRAGVRPQFNDMCMDTLLSLVPSVNDPNRTVRDEVLEYAESITVQRSQTRFLMHKPHGVGRLGGKKMELGVRDRIDLFLLASKFGLKPSHSAAEFRRYLHRFSNLNDLNVPRVLDMGRYNVHESIVVPIARFLQSQGVDFRFNTTICDVLFAYDNANDPSEPTRVTAIQTSPARERSTSISSREEKTIQLRPDDIVIVSMGSVYSSMLKGSNTRSPPSLERIPTRLDSEGEEEPIDSELDENWLLWLELCTKHAKFGNAYNFCTRVKESRIESFTITLSSPEFFTRLAGTTGDNPGPNTILTLRDSSWLITLRIPAQPVFPDQPEHIQVCWGYALHPERDGDYVAKPMLHCSGEEILTEILAHLRWEPEHILQHAITIPCIQPRAAATLLPRDVEDRPRVIPKGMRNMAVIGPFVEIADEVVVTTDYSVRGAQMAVHGLMGLQREIPKSKRGSAISLLGLL
ncbi:streptococcal 67 kDa myosin-cross-reactive antigen like family-domain-containing protein [Aspergillus pseudoustus]|uniref:Streptococcal 67 kDa myosin-cross-reactive antigen like family-domain-containing protein n=1 Tax=Aspergillus pseudoustus TaxID=1810923 RepID=A0ABR4JL51_9EURO